ncbi:MAG: phosphopantothenate/pantothenate synthetase [Candidatus Heimdallarchaeota archaeon]|nr:MAG: phosphopantothenate/pantothenate synthetase [Candidatus Heimdallarchaeota archaeon]
MVGSSEVPKDHPRYESLVTREKIIEGMHQKIVAEAGLIAHGRGEAFDYILGEETPPFALNQERLAVIMLLLAEKPIISVNGNIAVLCPRELVMLSQLLEAPLEINLFYRKREREIAIEKVLKEAGAKEVFGIDPQNQSTIAEISHQRRIVDSRGIALADCVFVPLEDGDRTLALRKSEKNVITVDLNPLSRTSLAANVSITNNIVRAIPEMLQLAQTYRKMSSKELKEERKQFNNEKLLQEALVFMSSRLKEIANDKNIFEIL